MAQYIDENTWWNALGKPNWYLLLAEDFERLEALAEQHNDEPNHKQIKGEAYALVERAIRENHIPLSIRGEDFDSERKPIDTIVIHHTKNPAGMTLERLNAIQLLRIYGSYYAKPTKAQHSLLGQPIWSGHFYKDQQVFWGYHWLIRADGTAEQILDDKYIGWHAGDWSINTRSIGIAIDNDLSHKQPSQKVIDSIADVIHRHYRDVQPVHIIGHHDANPHTMCPGSLFDLEWRQRIIDALR